MIANFVLQNNKQVVLAANIIEKYGGSVISIVWHGSGDWFVFYRGCYFNTLSQISQMIKEVEGLKK